MKNVARYLFTAMVSGFWIAAAALMAEAPQKEEPPQKFAKVAEGVYAAFPPLEADHTANSGFVIGKTAVWVFDAQRRPFSTMLLSEVRKYTSLPVKYVILSHHHQELVDGVPVFKDATVLGHTNMRRNLIEEPRPGVRLPDITYEQQLTFYDGDLELQIIHLGRYHTDGDSVLFLPREKILFSGDLLPGIGGPGGMRQAHLREFPKTIDKALALDFETIVPGRGETLATKQDLRNFQKYLTQVVADVKKLVDRGATLEETKAGVKVPEYITPERRKEPSFKTLWDRTIDRAYAELKGLLEKP